MSNDPSKVTDEVAATLTVDPAIWAGAKADYEYWCSSDYELKHHGSFEECDPNLRKLFLDRAARVILAGRAVDMGQV
jgi:hypothetical protein